MCPNRSTAPRTIQIQARSIISHNITTKWKMHAHRFPFFACEVAMFNRSGCGQEGGIVADVAPAGDTDSCQGSGWFLIHYSELDDRSAGANRGACSRCCGRYSSLAISHPRDFAAPWFESVMPPVPPTRQRIRTCRSASLSMAPIVPGPIGFGYIRARSLCILTSYICSGFNKHSYPLTHLPSYPPLC